MSDVVFVYATHPNETGAAVLGRSLVEQGLAACVNLFPGMRTIYRWEGQIETGEETAMIIKTSAGMMDAIQAHVRANHPYVCPCVVALPVVGGDFAYLSWIMGSVARPGEG